MHSVHSHARGARAATGTCRISARPCIPSILLHCRPQSLAVATAAAPANTATAAVDSELDALAASLLTLRARARPDDPSDAAVATAATQLEQRAAELGRSVDRAHVSGVFQGHTLTGRNVKATSGDMPLGALAFNAYQAPAGTLVRIVGGGDAPSRILRGGERFGVGPESYVLSTCFDVVSLGGEGGEAAASPPPVPLRGFSHAVARGSWPESPANRMDLEFAAMVLEPAAGTDLGAWLAAFAGEINPSMDQATGRLTVPLPAGKGPKGWIDHLATTPKHTLIRGNFGSVSLLVRAEE